MLIGKDVHTREPHEDFLYKSIYININYILCILHACTLKNITEGLNIRIFQANYERLYLLCCMQIRKYLNNHFAVPNIQKEEDVSTVDESSS